MAGPSLTLGSPVAFLPGVVSHSCQSGPLRAGLSPSPTKAGGSRPPLFAMPAKKAAGLIFEISWTSHLSFAVWVNSDARCNPSSCADFRSCRPRRSGEKRKHPKPPYYSSDPFSISDPYPRTIELALSMPLVSLQVNKSIAPPREAANESLSSAPGVPICHATWQATTIPKAHFTCARRATANRRRAPSTTHARPTGAKNAQQSPISL